MFYTSGEDRIFPRGCRSGKVTSVQEGRISRTLPCSRPASEAAPGGGAGDRRSGPSGDSRSRRPPIRRFSSRPDVKSDATGAMQAGPRARRHPGRQAAGSVQENRRRPEASVRRRRAWHAAAQFQSEGSGGECARPASRQRSAGTGAPSPRHQKRSAGRQPPTASAAPHQPRAAGVSGEAARTAAGSAAPAEPNAGTATLMAYSTERILVDDARQVRAHEVSALGVFRGSAAGAVDSGLSAAVSDPAIHFEDRAAAARDHLFRAHAPLADSRPHDRHAARPGAGFAALAANRHVSGSARRW